jgi:hypothetical protein
MEVDRTQYEIAHGKSPRGTGLWMFALGRNGAWTEFSFNGKFGDALRAAKQDAKSIGCTVVVVQS